MTNILVIDDDPTLRELVCRTFEHAGYTVFGVAEGEAGFRILDREAIDLVLTDLYMPGQDGIVTIRRLRRERPDLPVIVMSGGSEAGDLTEAAVALGARLALHKPFQRDALLDAVRGVLGAG